MMIAVAGGGLWAAAANAALFLLLLLALLVLAAAAAAPSAAAVVPPPPPTRRRPTTRPSGSGSANVNAAMLLHRTTATATDGDDNDGAAARAGGGACCHCRSNATHVVWHQQQYCSSKNKDFAADSSDTSSNSADNSSSGCNGCDCCVWQTLPQAQTEAYRFLRDHIMAFDRPFRATLGFRDNGGGDDDDTDGLADGLVEPAIRWALQAKIDFGYADRLPREIFHEYVLNYANLNEGRTDVRRLLRERLVEPLFFPQNNSSTTGNNNNENRTIAETVKILNAHMWTLLSQQNSNSSNSIRFVAGQTPAVFDATSVLAFGYASCTGLAVLFVEALRCAGVPARVAGTAAWHSVERNGNHNWVEVWTGGETDDGDDDDAASAAYDWHQAGWKFLEPSPAQSDVDTVDRDPCGRWFCSADRFRDTQVYAARLVFQNNSNSNTNNNSKNNNNNSTACYFPLAWEWDCTDVPAVDRTAYYRRVCGQCGGDGGGDDGSDGSGDVAVE